MVVRSGVVWCWMLGEAGLFELSMEPLNSTHIELTVQLLAELLILTQHSTLLPSPSPFNSYHSLNRPRHNNRRYQLIDPIGHTQRITLDC